MAQIKVSELFYSIQGEAKYCGTPSIFLRTFGCNFRCKNFGLPASSNPGNYNSEVRKIIDTIHQYKSYEELPLVETGCDSYAAVYPEFKKFSPLLTTEDIVAAMKKLLPGGKFSRDKHLIITGGEPLLGWQRSYKDLFNEIRLHEMDLTNVTFETNGTQPLSEELFEVLSFYGRGRIFNTTFSVSAKLPCSGESWDDAIRPAVVQIYSTVENADVYLKFVVSTEEDIEDVRKAVGEFRNAGVDCPVYIMPCGGTAEGYQMTERQVADFARDNGFRFSPRLQVPLYKNAWAT